MHRDDHDKLYVTFHQQLLNAFIDQVRLQPPFMGENSNDDDRDFLIEFNKPPSVGGTEQLIQGQQLLCKIVATYPHLMPLLPRDLLWYFGGDCLHYMPDEEIALFQRLDEMRQQAIEDNEPFSYEEARGRILGLH